MPQHLCAKELDRAHDLARKGKAPIQVHVNLAQTRTNKGLEGPHLTNVRKGCHVFDPPEKFKLNRETHRPVAFLVQV